MHKNNHQKQLLLKGLKTGFAFQFSSGKEDLYINELEQNIDYGWEAPSDEKKSFRKSVTQVAFNKDKTTHDITVNGFIYINTGLGSGISKLKKLKDIANTGETWYLIDNLGNKLKGGGGKGVWYIKNIRQNSTDFIKGLNALKISFSITINKYN